MQTMNKPIIDDNEVRKALSILREKDDSLFEIRICDTDEVKNASGYFTNVDVMLKELHKQRLNGKNVYVVLNKINDACYARRNHDCFIIGARNTGDKDIEYRQWLFLDFDSAHPSGTSSTDEQCGLAFQKMKNVVLFLVNEGFTKPVIAFSGNGYHALFPVKLKNDQDNLNLIKKFFKTLKTMFDDSNVEIDKQNVNAGRICKLYGTLAQKGLDLPKYPHRMSKILQVPDKLEPTSKAYIKKVADMLDGEDDSKERKDRTWQGNYKKFDLDEWLNNYNIGYKTEPCSGGTKYILDHCPFDETHKGKDAVIFKMDNGAIAFHCFHSSCADKTWRDVRLLYEPDAYSKRKDYNEYRHFNRNYSTPEALQKHEQKSKEEPVFFTPLDVLNRTPEKEYFIKSGLTMFDKNFRGLKKKGVTCLSGYTGGAKSTLLSEIAINAIDDGNNVVVFSGELAEEDYFRWAFLQAAGKSRVEATDFENYYNVPLKTQKQIAKWMQGHLWLYNNSYGMEYESILEDIKTSIKENKVDLVCIDNLMVLDIRSLSQDKLDAQSNFATSLHNLALEFNVHIIVVCHPRKASGLLGRYDIAGSGNLANTFENIIYTYRVDQEFRNYYYEFYKKEFDGKGTNCYHVAKARFGSVNDDYYDLFYEPETKRLKNDPAEYRHYEWEKDIEIPDEELFV